MTTGRRMGLSRSARCCRSPRRPMHHARQWNPTQRPARAKRDDELRIDIPGLGRKLSGLWTAEGLAATGPRRRRGRPVYGRAVDGRDGLGRRRARPRWITTLTRRPPSSAGSGGREFAATRPNQLWVSDSPTSRPGGASMWPSCDVFARRIVGWRVSASLRTGRRARASGLRTRRRSRAAWFITVTEARSTCRCGTGPTPGRRHRPVGRSRGDSYDNALAETRR